MDFSEPWGGTAWKRRTAQPRAENTVSVGSGCKRAVASAIYRNHCCAQGHMGKDTQPPALSRSSFRRSPDSNCPWMEAASRIGEGWPNWLCAIAACSSFPIMTNAYKKTGTTKRLHNPRQLKRRKPDTPIPRRWRHKRTNANTHK